MIHEIANWHPVWRIDRWASEWDKRTGVLYTREESFEFFGAPQFTLIDGNCLLNAGITVMLNLVGGIAATAFSNANACLGVGDSSTAAAATQTGLQASTNKTYKAMNATYPSVSNQTITFKSDFGSSYANYAWAEMVCGNNQGSPPGTCMNRVVSAQGTKTAGQTWTLSLAITLS